jgi:hypothetical protein
VKIIWPSYDIRPMMLVFFVGKQLAPFERAHIDKVRVDRAPELCARVLGWNEQVTVFILSSHAVIGKISREVRTENTYSAEPVFSGHRLGVHGFSQLHAQFTS